MPSTSQPAPQPAPQLRRGSIKPTISLFRKAAHEQEQARDKRLRELMAQARTDFAGLGIDIHFLSEMEQDLPSLFGPEYRQRFPMPAQTPA